MNKQNLIPFFIFVCLATIMLFSINAFAVTYTNPAKYKLVYNQTPDEDFQFSDLNLYQNIYSEYSGRNMPLPRYIPQYLSQDLYLRGYSSLSKKVIGMYVPRYFDGEQYTNFRIDSYNPRDLNVTEKSYLDQASLIVSPAKDTQAKCNYVAYWSFARDFTPDYGKGNRTLYDVYYYYDLGYWYVDEIRDAFVDDCPFIYSSYKVTTPTSYNYLYWDTKINKFRIHKYISNICELQSDFTTSLYTTQMAFLGGYYNSSSDIETSIKIYEDVASTINTDGTCTNGAFTIPCFPRSELVSATQIKDSWMMEVVNGNYIPKSRKLNGVTLDVYLLQNDNRYKECLRYFSNPYMGAVGSAVFLARQIERLIPNSNAQQCDAYLQERRKTLLKESKDWSIDGVGNMIWNHYKQDYNIPKGTNLYPFNIKYAGIRCKENDTWRTYEVNPMSPNAQTPYVECNYTASDPQIVNIGFNFDVKINPAFAMVSGSDSILESYNADYLRTLFQSYTFLTGNTTPLINIKNYSSGSTITAYFSVNRSKADGCSFTFLTNTSARIITEKLNDLTYQTQKNAENVPAEVEKQLEVQVRLLKSEAEKTQFYFYIDIIAKLIFRAFVMFYYIVSIIMMLYLIKLIIQIPHIMVSVLNSLGTSKKNRQNNSILNR